MDDSREPTPPEQLHDVAEGALDDLTDLREHVETTDDAARHLTPATDRAAAVRRSEG